MAKLTEVLPERAKGKKIELWFQDEARVGQKGTLTRVWARRGSRPPRQRDQRYDCAYIFGAVILIDGAGWHRDGGKLAFPDNVTPLRLPPYSPELNAQENVWQYLRQNHLAGRIFDTYDDIVDACCKAWNSFTAVKGQTTSIASREWLITGQNL